MLLLLRGNFAFVEYEYDPLRFLFCGMKPSVLSVVKWSSVGVWLGALLIGIGGGVANSVGDGEPRLLSGVLMTLGCGMLRSGGWPENCTGGARGLKVGGGAWKLKAGIGIC